MARRAAGVFVGHGDAGPRELHLPRWPAENEGGALAALGSQMRGCRVGPQAFQLRTLAEFRTVLGERQRVPLLGVRRLAFDNDAPNPQAHHLLPRLAAGARLFDPVGQRALAANTNPASRRGRRAGQAAGREDQLVRGAERVTLRIHFLQQDLRRQRAAAERRPLRRVRLLGHHQRRHVYPQDPVHESLLGDDHGYCRTTHPTPSESLPASARPSRGGREPKVPSRKSKV